nr:hypothetical protein [Rhizobium sp. P28RR-XV]
MGRCAQPVETAAFVLWLVRDASSFVTGASVPIDGGSWPFGGIDCACEPSHQWKADSGLFTLGRGALPFKGAVPQADSLPGWDDTCAIR